MLCTTLHWKLLTWIFVPYTRIFYDIGSLLFYTICRILCVWCWNLRIFLLLRFYVKSISVILDFDNLRGYIVEFLSIFLWLHFIEAKYVKIIHFEDSKIGRKCFFSLCEERGIFSVNMGVNIKSQTLHKKFFKYVIFSVCLLWARNVQELTPFH